MTEPRVTITDIVQAGYCVSGIRDWMKNHGMDIREFIRDGGMPISEAEKIDDAIAQRCVAVAKKREGIE